MNAPAHPNVHAATEAASTMSVGRQAGSEYALDVIREVFADRNHANPSKPTTEPITHAASAALEIDWVAPAS